MYVSPLKATKVCEVICFYLVGGNKVIGSIHLPPNGRITEVINVHCDQKPFVPLTDVTIIDSTGKEKKCPFIVLNRTHIIFCFPAKESCSSEEGVVAQGDES